MPSWGIPPKVRSTWPSGRTLLTPRAINVDVARDLVREMKWYDDYLERGSADRSANPTPGNKRGGLSNVVEKALGSVAKAAAWSWRTPSSAISAR